MIVVMMALYLLLHAQAFVQVHAPAPQLCRAVTCSGSHPRYLLAINSAASMRHSAVVPPPQRACVTRSQQHADGGIISTHVFLRMLLVTYCCCLWFFCPRVSVPLVRLMMPR